MYWKLFLEKIMLMLQSLAEFKIVYWELFWFRHFLTQAGLYVHEHIVKLADGNIAKECIKWNPN